jgi:hypothetical protein
LARHGWHAHCKWSGVRAFLSTILFLLLWQSTTSAGATPLPEFPFEYRDGFIWVKAAVAHTNQPLNFLVDTGAEVSVVDQRVVAQLGLKLGRCVRVAGVQSTTTGFWPQRLAAKVGAVTLPRDWLALDLGPLSRSCATPVDGLLGADFFHGKIVQIDFPARVIRLLTPEQAGALKGETLALDLRRCGMRVPVSINADKPQWLRLDTGCAAALHWVTTSVDSNLCRPERAIGLTELSLSTTAVMVGLGSQTFEAVAAVVHERPIFAGESGLLGNGLLARFAQVTVDSRGKRLILTR